MNAEATSPGATHVSCEPGSWRETMRGLQAQGYTFFDFLTAVDELDADEQPGFTVLAHLYDIRDGRFGHIQVATRIAEGQSIDSLTALWPGAAWHERETWEMFGIGFDGFDDGTGLGLRKLLLPGGFDGHPLLKSFVLTARVSKPWPGAKEPGGNAAAGKPARAPRKRLQPPGIPDDSWGPR